MIHEIVQGHYDIFYHLCLKIIHNVSRVSINFRYQVIKPTVKKKRLIVESKISKLD